MTRKEKWQELNTDKNFNELQCCPYDELGIEDCDCISTDIICQKCWNKEYNQNEVKK